MNSPAKPAVSLTGPINATHDSIAPSAAAVNDAVPFLQVIRPDSPWMLLRIATHKDAKPKATWCKNPEQVERFVTGFPDDDIYFVPAEIMPGINKKPKDEDIRASRWAWVDVDPSKDKPEPVDELEARLLPHDPTVVLRSGSGVWGLWELDAETTPDHIREINYWFANKIGGGDKCHDPSRIVRLPGTVNQKNGKVATWQKVGRVHRAEHMQRLTPPDRQMAQLVGDDVVPPDEEYLAEVLNENAYDRAMHPEKYLVNGSRNENAFSLMRSLVGHDDLTDGQRLGILLHCPVSDFFERTPKGEARNADRFVREQLARAQGSVERGEAERPNFHVHPKQGHILNSLHNTREAIEHLGLDIWFDTFANRAMVEGHALQEYSGVATDTALVIIRKLVRLKFQFEPSKEMIYDAFDEIAQDHRRNPVADYLDGLSWDGVARLETWLQTVYGVPDDTYHRTVGSLLLRGMVNRAYRPGCKFDYMVVLEGPEGARKSSSLRVLATGTIEPGHNSVFGDAAIFHQKNPRDRSDLIRGKWLNEVAELSGMNKQSAEDVKQFITIQADEYRAAYARLSQSYPRTGVLVGTSNPKDWLRDATGGRRFLPVATSGLADTEWLIDHRDQLFAEAVVRKDEPLFLSGEAKDLADAQVDERRKEDPWDDLLEGVRPDQVVGDEDRLANETVWAVLDVPKAQRTGPMLDRLISRMRRLGWEKGRNALRINGHVTRGFVRPATGQAPNNEDDVPF